MSLTLKSLGLIEIILIQIITWTAIWLFDDYLASLLTVVMVPIFFFILVVALIAEWIERSKVPKKFFLVMILSVLVPVIIAAFAAVAYQGVFSWMTAI